MEGEWRKSLKQWAWYISAVDGFSLSSHSFTEWNHAYSLRLSLPLALVTVLCVCTPPAHFRVQPTRNRVLCSPLSLTPCSSSKLLFRYYWNFVAFRYSEEDCSPTGPSSFPGILAFSWWAPPAVFFFFFQIYSSLWLLMQKISGCLGVLQCFQILTLHFARAACPLYSLVFKVGYHLELE